MEPFFKTTETGKCDVIITLFTSCHTFFMQRSITFDVKPTFKYLKETYKPFKKEGAKYMRVSTMPSCNTKTINL